MALNLTHTFCFYITQNTTGAHRQVYRLTLRFTKLFEVAQDSREDGFHGLR